MLGFIGVICFKLTESIVIVPVPVISVTVNDRETLPVEVALNICWYICVVVPLECSPPTTAPRDGVI